MSSAQVSRRAARGLLFLAVTAILWGTAPVATNLVYHVAATNAPSVAFFRLALALPLLLPVTWRSAIRRGATLCGGRSARFAGRDLAFTLLFGAGVASYQVLYFAAIPLVGVTIAALVTLCMAPLMVALLSAILLRERPGAPVLLALASAVSGTALLLGLRPDELQLQPHVEQGILLALGAALSYAVVTLSGRAISSHLPSLPVVAVGMAAGTFALLPIALLAGLVLSYPPAGWALLVYLGVVPTALAYLLFLHGVRFTTATVASTVNLLEPLTSVVLAWLLFREPLDLLDLLGSLLLLGAMVLLYRHSAAPPLSTTKPVVPKPRF